MTQGPGRFEYYLIKLDDILQKASQTENPGLYLYQNDARTKLFMLEGLAKLYEGLHDRKLFCRLKKQFKALEDLIGAMDYYDAFSKDFLADPGMPVTIRMFTEQRRDESLAKLNALLLKKRWINHAPSRTKKIRKKLRKAGWQTPGKEIILIRDFYKKSIKEIGKFYAAVGSRFTDLESQVHSLRRKLRWLSIYPQALQGAVQFANENVTDENLKKYLTPEIVNSPFNKMPGAGNNEMTLLLEKDYFLALSFMIDALGKLKDAGLRILVTAEAEERTQFLSKENAMKKALELNNLPETGLQGIMDKAEELCDPYFAEKYLEKIVAVKKEDELSDTSQSIIHPEVVTGDPE